MMKSKLKLGIIVLLFTIAICSAFYIILPNLSVKDSYVHSIDAYDFSEDEIKDICITYRGIASYKKPKTSDLFDWKRTRAIYGEIKGIKTYYKKTFDEKGSFIKENVVAIMVEKNISGGFQKNETINIIDAGLNITSEDIGKKGIFVPNNVGYEVKFVGSSEVVKAIGEIVPEENRYVLENKESELSEIKTLNHLKKYWNEHNLAS